MDQPVAKTDLRANGHADACIKIRGARVNNLRNIDVDLPRSELIVLTGSVPSDPETSSTWTCI